MRRIGVLDHKYGLPNAPMANLPTTRKMRAVGRDNRGVKINF